MLHQIVGMMMFFKSGHSTRYRLVSLQKKTDYDNKTTTF